MPYNSHRLQPLKFSVPLKTACNRNPEYYMPQNPGNAITQYEIVELFKHAFNRCSNLGKHPTDFKQQKYMPAYRLYLKKLISSKK